MEKGYETTINLMAVSKVLERDLTRPLRTFPKASTGCLCRRQLRVHVFGADSFSGKNILSAAGQGIGIHTHNNLQLAFANTIEAIIAGVNRIDATIYGMAGAGNCPLELFFFPEKSKFDIRPIIEVIQELFIRSRLKRNGLPYYHILSRHA